MDEDQAEFSLNLSEENINIAVKRMLNLLNKIYSTGFYEMGIIPKVDMGFSGDVAIVLEKYNQGKPMLDPEKQRKLVMQLVESDNDVFYFDETHESYSGAKRPVYLIREIKTGKKIMGMEWDKVVIYQPDEPNVVDYMPHIAEEIRTGSQKLKES
jgi:hypothetical protein